MTNLADLLQFRNIELPLSNVAALRAKTWKGSSRPREIRLLAHTTAGDRGGGVFYWDATSNATDNGGTIIKETATAVGRWIRQYFGALDLRWFGAIPKVNDSTSRAANDAAFAAIEALTPTENISLQGYTWAVNAYAGTVYTNQQRVQFYGGKMISSSGASYDFSERPLAHPLDGTEPATVLESKEQHPWPGPCMWSPSDDRIVSLYVDSWRHDVAPGAPLKAEKSRDGVDYSDADGDEWLWADDPTVTNPTEPRGVVGCAVSGTRNVAMWCTVNNVGGGTVTGMKAAYQDYPGATWTVINLAPGTPFFPHGQPVISGSNITFYGYGGGNIYYARVAIASFATPGAWTFGVAKAGSGAISAPVEAAVTMERANEWVMIVRDGDGAPGNAWGCTSTDGITWTAWVDTGIPLGSNPPEIVPAWGCVFLYMAARNGTAIFGYSDALLYLKYDAHELYVAIAGGTMPAQPAYQIAYRASGTLIGYMSVARLWHTRWIGYIIDKEAPLGSAVQQPSRLVRLGGLPAALTGPGTLQMRRTEPTFNLNANFRRWTRATSFAGITTTQKVADMIRVTAPGAAVTVSRVDLPDHIRILVPGAGRYGLRIQGASGGSGRRIMWRFWGRDVMTAMSNRGTFTMNAYVYGTSPGYFSCMQITELGTGGTSVAAQYISADTRDLAGGLTQLVCTGNFSALQGVTWGSTEPYFDVGLYQNNAGAIDMVVVVCGFDWGRAVIDYEQPRERDEDDLIDQYLEEIVYEQTGELVSQPWVPGSTACVDMISYKRKVRDEPDIIATAADYSVNGTNTLSAITFDKKSRRTARRIGTASGLSSGSQAELYTTTTNVRTLIDAEGPA